MRLIYLCAGLVFLFSCISSEKESYDSLIEKQSESPHGDIGSSREIAYLKNISQFEENNFQFITKQMKAVIKNYSKMKQQLVKIETKLDHLLNQLILGSHSSQKDNEVEVMESDSDAVSNLEDESGNTVAPEGSTIELNPEEPPLFQEEITDDTDIFPNGKTEENKYLQNQKKILEKIAIDKKSSQSKSSALIEAKNLFEEKSYESAISKFQKYRDENPKGSQYPEATFYIGQSFKNLKMPIEAEVFFKEIVKIYPQSLWASRAKQKLEE